MLFNTPNYIAFFLLIAIVVYILNRKKLFSWRNGIMLLASLGFYANLNIWYPLLLLYIIGVNWLSGKAIHSQQKQEKSAKGIVASAIILSLLPLIFFKYAPFYSDDIWLPVGLSFFTFQALSYTLDLYRRKIETPFSLLNVALFISFFPTLLSGPIERARNLIPQLRSKFPITWANVCQGAQWFIWGLFKKMVIADRLAEWVNTVYDKGIHASGGTLALAAILYSFQIYCDFSGYASMALGSGKMLGINLTDNFNFPYFASSVKDFWRRWHISLTSWFTEYVYISLGGNRVSLIRWIINISAVFLLSGIWHGTTWSFVIWGAIHGILYLIEHFTGLKDKWGLYRIIVFIGVTLAWVFFRIEDSVLAAQMIGKMFTGPWFPIQHGLKLHPIAAVTSGLLIAFIITELLLYKNKMPKHWIWKAIGFSTLIVCIALFAASSEQFVYFKF